MRARHHTSVGAAARAGAVVAPRAEQTVEEGEALREVDVGVDVVALVVLGAQLDPERARDERRRPEVAPAVLDARVAVELLEKKVCLSLASA